MQRSVYAISLLLAATACGGEAAEQARESTAAPMQQTAPEQDEVPRSDADTIPQSQVAPDANTMEQFEAVPGADGDSESYESCMARVNQGGDRGANSASCSHVADAPQ